MAKKTSSTRKSNTKKQARKPTLSPDKSGAPFSEQDPKRRLGNFGGAGEHPRQGGRTSGIVGQTKKRNKTDKSS
jgi:hypothetical protein